MKKQYTAYLLMVCVILAGFILSACDQGASASTDCPEPTNGTLLQSDEALGYCLLYPDSHTVIELDSGNKEVVVGEVMNHIDPRVSIFTEELGNRTLEQAVDEFLTGFEGFDIGQTDLTLSGEEAVQLDAIPGQDFYRKVLVAHDDLIYHLSFAPFDPGLPDTFPMAEQLYDTVINSFTFTNS